MENEADASEWELRHDETSGQAYYVNLVTGESSWEAPGISALPSDGSVSVHRQWTEAHDETGRVYFVNLATMETSWDPPPGMYSAVSARAAGERGAVEDTLMRRPSTAEQMEQLNALLSGGDGGEGDDDEAEELSPSVAVVNAGHGGEDDAAMVTQASDGSEWMMFLNETDGIPYYYNHITGECVWEPPASFLEYHLQHSDADHSNGPPTAEHDANGEPTELRMITTPRAPHPPMSPPPASPSAQTPVVITPEFEEKVRRAIETVSKTPVGSSRLLFVRTPTVKSIEGVSSARSGSRPTSASGRAASRPSSSTGTARQRVTTARTLVESDQISSIMDASEAPATEEGVMESGDAVTAVVAEGGDADEGAHEEIDVELQRRDEMMQELLLDETALVIQCVIRCFVARRRVARKRQERQQAIEVASNEDAVVGNPEPEQNVTDQEATDRETLLNEAVEGSHDPELNNPELSVGTEEVVPVRDPDADTVVVEDSTRVPDAIVMQQEESAQPEFSFIESEAPAPEDETHSLASPEVVETVADSVEVQVDGEAIVLAEEETQVVAESDEPEVANDLADTVVPQPESDAEGAAHDQGTVAINESAEQLPSEPELVGDEAADSAALPLTDGVERKEDEREVVKQPDSLEEDSVEAEAGTGKDDSGVEHEQPAIEEPSTVLEGTLQEAQLVEDAVGVVPIIGSDGLLAQAARDASTEKTPEPTRRSARQVAKSGRRTERATTVSPTREHAKSTVDTSAGRLTVLNIASFFPVRVPREHRAHSKAVKAPLQTNGGIIRKPVPTQCAPVATAVKTDEQRQQELLARTAVKEKERQEASAQWKQQVAQYQQLFANSATRSSAERQRILEAETQRHQATALEKQNQSRKTEAETKSSVANQHTNSLWEAADNSNKDDAVDQIRALKKAASEPEGFVDLMMQERLRMLKATVARLQREGNQDKAAHWQQRVQGFPSSAAELEDCQDAYWTRLHSNLQTLASSSSAQELTQQLAKHRTDSLDSLLHMAAWNGNAAVVELLVSELGFDVNAPDNSVNHATPLHEASRSGHVDVVECLLARGAHLDAIDAHGDTPLHIASRMGHRQVVHRLIAAGETHQEREDLDSSAHARVFRSLSWAHCVHWRNNKHRRAVDVATLPSLKEFLTQYSSEYQADTDAAQTNHGSHSHGSSAASATVKHSKVAAKRKKIKSARPKSAAKASSMPMSTAAAALAVHAR